jgi:uncharacterized protein (TIGR03435 family)
MNAVRLSVAAALAAVSLFAQSQATRPEFEVASIKPSPSQVSNQAAVGLKLDGAQVRAHYMPLREYLAMAYRVKPNQIQGPEWMASERFDIVAKIPSGQKLDQFPEMLQALLQERFKLKSRLESKEFPVYGLVAVKGGFKLQRQPDDPEEANRSVFDMKASGSSAGVTVDFGHGSSFSLGNNKIEIRRLTLDDFAESLTRFADRPVVNMTETPGRYDFTVDVTPEDYRAILIRSAINAGVTLPPEALRMLEGVSAEATFLSMQRVGLKLESRKAPLPVLVVESIAKMPTEN